MIRVLKPTAPRPYCLPAGWFFCFASLAMTVFRFARNRSRHDVASLAMTFIANISLRGLPEELLYFSFFKQAEPFIARPAKRILEIIKFAEGGAKQ